MKKIVLLSICLSVFFIGSLHAQSDDLTFSLDFNSGLVPTPKVFNACLDLSGRGFDKDNTRPQTLASDEVLDVWSKEIGFNTLYRLQFNLWEVSQLAANKQQQDALLAKYEALIKKINEHGGTVILNIFGTPQGMGKVLDKKSVPVDLNVYKELIKQYVRDWSCNKKYKIWYEVWSAPDLEDFFVGRQQDYLALYRAVAECITELEAEAKMDIPIGGPSSSWWFRNSEGNSIIQPEGSLIYELIKFCYQYKLPLDFISWHAYSTDPKVERENTKYNRSPVELIRNWLTYFNFDGNLPIIIDEWNYDSGFNLCAERKEKSFINASYIPSRMKNMADSGIDYQIFFALEDFQDNKESINRNVGIFYLDQHNGKAKSGPKAVYNAFKMISLLGSNMFSVSGKLTDDFVGVVATKSEENIFVLIYNYIDPDAAKNYLSRNIALFNDAERDVIVDIVKTDKWEKILSKELNLNSLQLTSKAASFLTKAQEIHDRARKLANANRTLNLELKNLKGDYAFQRYVIDSACSLECNFAPAEEKDLAFAESYQWPLTLTPYSVNFLVFKLKPKQEIKVEDAAQVKSAEPENKAAVVEPEKNKEPEKLKEEPKDAKVTAVVEKTNEQGKNIPADKKDIEKPKEKDKEAVKEQQAAKEQSKDSEKIPEEKPKPVVIETAK